MNLTTTGVLGGITGITGTGVGVITYVDVPLILLIPLLLVVLLAIG